MTAIATAPPIGPAVSPAVSPLVSPLVSLTTAPNATKTTSASDTTSTPEPITPVTRQVIPLAPRQDPRPIAPLVWPPAPQTAHDRHLAAEQRAQERRDRWEARQKDLASQRERHDRWWQDWRDRQAAHRQIRHIKSQLERASQLDRYP